MAERFGLIIQALIWFIAFFAVLYVGMKIMSHYSKKKDLPQKRIKAKIIKKNDFYSTIVFKTIEDETITLSVIKPVYKCFKEGDEGELVYQKDTFLAFERSTDEQK